MFPGVIVIALLVAAAVLFYRARFAGRGYVSSAQVLKSWRQPARIDHRPAVQRRDFRAVSIKCGPGACKAARALEGKRGFPNQIPRLPLSQCDSELCTCTYTRHADRRCDDRRILQVVSSDAGGVERRQADRRCDPVDRDLDVFNFRDR